jgi:hypothetical protein
MYLGLHVRGTEKSGCMNLHPDPLYQPIPVKAVIPKSLGAHCPKQAYPTPETFFNEQIMRAITTFAERLDIS